MVVRGPAGFVVLATMESLASALPDAKTARRPSHGSMTMSILRRDATIVNLIIGLKKS